MDGPLKCLFNFLCMIFLFQDMKKAGNMKHAPCFLYALFVAPAKEIHFNTLLTNLTRL